MANKNELKSQEKGETTKRLDRLDWIMATVIFVLLIGFASVFVAVLSLVINADGEKHASYQQLETQIQTQNTQIQVLTNQIKNSTVTPK